MSKAPEEPIRVEIRGDKVFLVGTRTGASLATGELVGVPGGLRYKSGPRTAEHYFYKHRGLGISTCILDLFGANHAYSEQSAYHFRSRIDQWFVKEQDPTVRKIVEVEIIVTDANFVSTLRSKLWRWSVDSGLCSTAKNTVWPNEEQRIMPDSLMDCIDDRMAIERVKIKWRDILWPARYGTEETNGRV